MQQDLFGTFPSAEQPSFQAACHLSHCCSRFLASRQARISFDFWVIRRTQEQGRRRSFGCIGIPGLLFVPALGGRHVIIILFQGPCPLLLWLQLPLFLADEALHISEHFEEHPEKLTEPPGRFLLGSFWQMYAEGH